MCKHLWKDEDDKPISFKTWLAQKKEHWRKKRLYKKQLRQCVKRLKKAASTYGPWDEGYLFSFMEIIFEHWVQYYSLGYNVWAQEDCEWNPYCKNDPTRKEIAEELLYRLRDMQDRFTNIDLKTKAFCDYFAKYIHYMWD